MRIADNIPPKVKGAVVVLTLLGLALNLVLAVSPLWGWHPFLGWASSAVLFAFAWDERKSLRAAMQSEAIPGDRLIAYFLIGAPVIGLLANTGFVLFAK
jgi:hypothetical protein